MNVKISPNGIVDRELVKAMIVITVMEIVITALLQTVMILSRRYSMFSESMFPDLDDVLCVEDASSALKISSQAVYKYLKSGELRGFRNGKVWRIPKAGLCEFVLRQSRLK